MAAKDTLDEVEDSAVDDLVEQFSSDRPDRDAVKAALGDYVRACVRRELAAQGEPEGDEEEAGEGEEY